VSIRKPPTSLVITFDASACMLCTTLKAWSNQCWSHDPTLLSSL
jgi:hypothetical protein